MAKFICIPEPAVIRDPISDEPTPDHFPFFKTVRVICALAVDPQAQPPADLLTVIDVRRKLGPDASSGTWVELSDDEYNALLPHFKNPRGMMSALKLSIEDHLRAYIDAPSKRPAPLS